MRGIIRIICSLLVIEGVLCAGTVSSLLNNLLAGTNSTAPQNPAASVGPSAPQAPAPASPAAAPAPPQAPPAASPVQPQAPPNAPAVPPQAPSTPPAAPVPPQAPSTPPAAPPAAPCPFANQPSAQAAPAAAAPPAAPKVYTDLEITQMNNQLTNLRTSIELFQDYQKPIHVPLTNPMVYPLVPQDRSAVIQSIMNMYLPILEVANAPQNIPPVPAAKGTTQRVFDSIEVMKMNGQLTNLRLMVEIFQDFQRKYNLPNSNTIMQKAYALWDPILKASGSIQKTPFLQPQ